MKALFLAVSLLSVCSMASAESLKESLEKSNKLATAALLKKDINLFVKAMKPTVTSDFQYVERGQAMNFDKMVAAMKMGLGSLSKVTSASAKIISIKETGDTATVKGFHSMGGVVIGPDKKNHIMEYGGDTTETLKKVKGKWLMTKMVWKDAFMKMDGKPFDPTAGAAPK